MINDVLFDGNTLTKGERDKKFEASFRNDPNNFSHWYPKLQKSFQEYGVDYLSMPRSVIIPVPLNVMRMLFDPANNIPQIHKFVREGIMPKIPNDMFFIFMKNGTFSNKYDFNCSCKCRRNELELTNNFININYGAACCDAGGISEIVLRDYIGDWNWLDEHVPCIYNGMPLRPEFRVFYNFDNRLMYLANYWDYNYCHEAIERSATDKIVYDSYYPYILNFYENNKCSVERLVADSMGIVEGLSGEWSIDVMWDAESRKYWLIDMAKAEQSAYYR